MAEDVDPAVADAIRRAAEKTGAPEDYLWKLSRQESGLNPAALPPVNRKTGRRASSAYGLNQFLNSSWVEGVARYGLSGYPQAQRQAQQIVFGKNRQPIIVTEQDKELLKLRGAPAASAEMAGRYAAQNGSQLEPVIGRPPTGEELYLAHFRGAGGARQMLDPANQSKFAADLAPDAARSNRTLFYDGDRKLTVAEAASRIQQVYARQPGGPITQSAPASEQPEPQSGLEDYVRRTLRTVSPEWRSPDPASPLYEPRHPETADWRLEPGISLSPWGRR